ncbi:MAG TPA: acid phosphatase, partial [Burkholderiaceae bacterium]|nr:acid phosphatase [Burkholderiaceae bacterium]
MTTPFSMQHTLVVAALVAGVLPAFAAEVDGLVVGPRGVYRQAKVCVDTNGNGRCDPKERATTSDDAGHFSLPAGAWVAEVRPGAALADAASGSATPVRRALVLRAPRNSGGVVGPLSTEVMAIAEGGGPTSMAQARQIVARRLGVPEDRVFENPAQEVDDAVRAALLHESYAVVGRSAEAVAAAGASGDLKAELADRLDLEHIETVVVIYAENRSFNNVFDGFPGAESIRGSAKAGVLPWQPQKDRDGSLLRMLPPAWGGLTAAGQKVTVTQAQTTNVLDNAPFRIDGKSPAWKTPVVDQDVVTRDLYHRFYENQMQIDGGRNDMFAAWGDSGGLVMGYWDGNDTALWKTARDYTLADHFFQGAFGGSFLNHQYLVCACAPEFPNADTAPAHPSITVVDKRPDGRWTAHLTPAPGAPESAMDGPPKFALSGNLTPKDYFGDGTFRAINTMQPAYEPSGNAPAADAKDALYADPANATTLPAQTITTIGDRLDAKQIAWKWYSGGWNAAAADRTTVYKAATGNFQAHHQPFNYYAEFDPATASAARQAHLKDADDLMADIAAGRLPAVAFYKPIGVDTEHPGYASLAQGDAHIAQVLKALQHSSQWQHMLVVVTYDEFGGQWDEVAP